MQDYESMDDAVRVARQILSGEMDPNLGCSLIAAIGEKRNDATTLGMFQLLAHEQHGHEEIGMTAESCVPDILAACRELLARA